MARVTFDSYADYAPRSASVINTAWTAVQTQSTNVNAENVADGGLDQRNIASGAATDGRDKVSYDGWETFAVAAAYPVWNDLTFTTGPTPISINNGGAGWAVGAGVGQVRLRFSAAFEFDEGARAFVDSPYVYWRLSFVDNTGTITPAAITSRHNANTQVCGNTGVVAADGGLRYVRDTVAWAYLIPNTGGRTSITSIKVQYALSVINNVRIGEVTLAALRFVKPS